MIKIYSYLLNRKQTLSYQRDVPVDKVKEHEHGRDHHQQCLVHGVHVDNYSLFTPLPAPSRLRVLVVVVWLLVVPGVGRGGAAALVRGGSHSVGLGDGELADGVRVRHGVVAVGGEGLDVAVVVEEDEVLQDGDEDEAQAGDDPDLGGKTVVLSA